MIDCIFTIDYEIYGNGQGSLAELVYEPARKLKEIFDRAGVKFVVFVEAAELERIAAAGTDRAIGKVERQVREFHEEGFEIALHLHPQWYNARHHEGSWELDYSEYNLCRLSKGRIEEIIDRSIAYLRRVVGEPQFTPLSFRAGNWLFQPTATAAKVLSERGIKVDSSVFKGGLQHQHQLDYRAATRNGFYWRFQHDVNKVDPGGALLEMPIYTRMVPFWRMATGKRLKLQRKSNAAKQAKVAHNRGSGMGRLRDYLRLQYPLKFDFCRMTIDESTRMMEAVVSEDLKTPTIYKPVAAIGHTKDLVDFHTINALLTFLRRRNLRVSTFKDIYPQGEWGC